MSLDFEIPISTIPVGKGNFTVRGLNSEDLTFLSVHYLDDMKNAVAKYAGDKEVPANALGAIVVDLAKDFPTLALEIISRAAEAREPADVEKLRRLSFVTHLRALKEIAFLTAQDAGIDLGNVLGVVESVLVARGVNPGPNMIVLKNIIAMFENPSPS